VHNNVLVVDILFLLRRFGSSELCVDLQYRFLKFIGWCSDIDTKVRKCLDAEVILIFLTSKSRAASTCFAVMLICSSLIAYL